jgi:hypothetical protein
MADLPHFYQIGACLFVFEGFGAFDPKSPKYIYLAGGTA